MVTISWTGEKVGGAYQVEFSYHKYNNIEKHHIMWKWLSDLLELKHRVEGGVGNGRQ